MPVITQDRIIKTEYSELMQKAYIDYAMSVIVSRALPDVRDGLKPVQRRVLYDMNELGILYDRPYRKSARIVGDTMGKYHPHGDASIYDALVVMSQDFKKGAALVDGHGNFGNIEGDPPAAMRYTEARLSKISQEALLTDLDKDVVDFIPNFDETESEPSVLPSKIPNLLINGSEGIAVGMATSIPPHNTAEVIDAALAMLADETISTSGLMKYVKGPDFPTGGIIVNKQDLPAIYETGTGKLRIRGRIKEEKGRNGHINLVVTEIPYTMIGAGISRFLQEVAALSENRTTTDIIDISNQSSKEGIRIVIELKKDTDVENFKALLYKKTRLEDTFGVNMLAISGGKPETMGLRAILKANIDFWFETTTRKYTNLLAKERDKKEIQEGLIRACNVIDLIIEIIRGSRDRASVKKCLVEGITSDIKFKSKESEIMAGMLRFTERQADAILDMRLYRLIGLEIEALTKEHEKTLANIYKYEDILERRDSMAHVISGELSAFKKEYGRGRLTSVEEAEEVVFKVKEEECTVYFLMDRFGYARCVEESTYDRNSATITEENRFVVKCKNTGKVCLFTAEGLLHTIKVSDLPFGKLRDKGVPVDNVSNYDSTKEEIICAASQSDLNLYRLVFATEQSMLKVVDGGEFDVSKRTVAATKLSEGDRVVDISIISDQKEMILATQNGYFLRFAIEEIPEKKKTAVGVRGMKLTKGDRVRSVYFTHIEDSDIPVILYDEKAVDITRIKPAHRDGKGSKLRI